MAEEFKLDDALGTALNLGKETARPAVTLVNTEDTDPHYIVRKPDGGVEFVPSKFHSPNFKAGSVQVLDVPSFAAYHKKHEETGTKVVASVASAQVVSTFDWHEQEFAGRGVHNLTLVCQRTPEWQKLKSANGKTFSQESFAEFLDDMAHCFDKPDSAALAEIVLNLEGTNNAAWASKIDRVSGGVQIAYTEEAQAKTRSGVLFPTQGEVVCPIFVGGPPMQFLVKFRYRVKDGSLTVGFVLDQTDRWEREAFLATVAQVKEATGATVLLAP